MANVASFWMQAVASHGRRRGTLSAGKDVHNLFLSMSTNPVSHLNMAVMLFGFFLKHFISSPVGFQHHFNKSEKGCKQSCTVLFQLWLEGCSKGPCRDIKDMQIASFFRSSLFPRRVGLPYRCWPTFSDQTHPLERWWRRRQQAWIKDSNGCRCSARHNFHQPSNESLDFRSH